MHLVQHLAISQGVPSPLPVFGECVDVDVVPL